MKQRVARVDLPRLAVNKTEAAEVIGVSVDFFDEHVAHELRCVRRGRRRLYAVSELQAWLEKAAERVRVAAWPGGVATKVVIAKALVVMTAVMHAV